ncbi:nephrocystin-1-like isoform X1 [Symsagittifera roscoffensis]|uniref:nephrocystin-1-like isoform X1 n=1 Tax=Symsagittifera roscoffensis TaxID=84072 RepID=UPI00307C4FA4
MVKKRVLDDKIKALATLRKKMDSDWKDLERLGKTVNEKTKLKFEDALKKCSDDYTQFKNAKQDLEALEDDQEKNFEKKKNSELELCKKSMEFLLAQMEMASEKEVELGHEIADNIKDVIQDIKKRNLKVDDEEEESDEENEDDEEDETEPLSENRTNNESKDEVTENIEEGESDEDKSEYTEYTEYQDPENEYSTLSKTNQSKANQEANQEQYIVLDDFKTDLRGDLDIHKGEVLTIILKREDGWWSCKNARGEQGLVPSNYLKLKVSAETKAADEEADDEAEYDSEEYEEEEDDEEEDYSDMEDEEDSKEDENEVSTVSEKQDKEDTEKSPRSNLKGWGSLRKQLHKRTEADIVAALGGGPSGFRPSTTAKLLHSENSSHSYVKALHPQISDSGFQMRDLFWDSKTSSLKPRETKALRTFRLLIAKNVPLPAEGVQVLCRYANICLFDGNSIQSNIMTVKATWNESDPKTWRFTPKTSGLIPTLLEGYGFFRFPSYIINLGLLVELNVAYHRPKSGEKGDMSCGRVYLKLCSDYGSSLAIGNKEFEIEIQGGTPFEKDVALDATATGDTSLTGSNTLRSLMSTKRQITLSLKMGELSKEEKQMASYLPVYIVMPVTSLQFTMFYRQILAQELLGGGKERSVIKPISSPFLANFPVAMDTPDLIDLLRSEWMELAKNMKRAEKKNPVFLRNSFHTLFLQTVYPIMYSYALPKFALNDQESQSERWRLINELAADTKKHPIATSVTIQYKPFLLQETVVDVINPYIASQVAVA